MAKIELPYVAWREGRPRFVPGARERAMGFKGQDLKHDDGRWYSLDEAHGFALAKQSEIHAQRKTGKKLKTPPVPRGRAFKDLWHAYTNSNEFRGNEKLGIKGLSPAAQDTYRKWIRPLSGVDAYRGRPARDPEVEWLAPVGSLDPIILKALHQTIMERHGKAMANGMMRAIAAALAWGRLRGWSPKVNGQIAASPASKLDLPSDDVRLRIGSDLEVRTLVEASDIVMLDGMPLSAVGDGVLTALFSGQRRSDVLAFAQGETSIARIELIQNKTGARVSIPMAPRLVERYASSRERRRKANYTVEHLNVVLHEQAGTPYHGDTFSGHYRLVRAAAVAGIVDEEATALARAAHLAEQRNSEPPTVWRVAPCPSLVDFTFADLRDTAVTWYARAGCTVPEIASISGHSLTSIYTILKHYLSLDWHLADNAVRKLVDYMEKEGMAV